MPAVSDLFWSKLVEYETMLSISCPTLLLFFLLENFVV